MTDTLPSQSRYSVEAEESIIGAALLSRPALEILVGSLDSAAFYSPANRQIAAVIIDLHKAGDAVDATTVADGLRRRGAYEAVGGMARLVHLHNNVPSLSPAHVSTWAKSIRSEAGARAAQWAMTRGLEQLGQGADPTAVADQVTAALRAMDRGGKLPERYWRSTDDYLAEDHSRFTTPLAEGVCLPLSKVMVVAVEKGYKSSVLRQVAHCFEAGIHPFNPTLRIEPVRTLILDAENPDDELVRAIPRVISAIDAAVPGARRPALFSIPYGFDLGSPRHRGELLDVLEDCKPQLIVGGPVYKLTDQREKMTEDQRAAQVQAMFNEIQQRWGAACMLEHHAPTGGKDGRPLKPKGGQVWPAWLSVCISFHSAREGQSIDVRYEGGSRGVFAWPKRFDRGGPGEWPWTPVLRVGDAKSTTQRMDMSEPPESEDEDDSEPF